MNTISTIVAATSLYLAAGLVPAAFADNCSSIAAAEASRRGAQVLSVRALSEGGRTVCEIKLRVPGSGGQPPRVEEIRASG